MKSRVREPATVADRERGLSRVPGNENGCSFEAALARGPIVLDGGMGTRLMALGLDPLVDDSALWNVTRPRDVASVHERDIAAGAEAILTNTFGANRYWLGRFGQQGAVEVINGDGVRLARQAAGPGRFVLGVIGPSAALLDGAATEQAAILIGAGVDALLLETYRFVEAERVLHIVKRTVAASMSVLVSLWEWPDPSGPTAQRLLDAGAAVIGLNCQPGIAAALSFVRGLDRQVQCPLLVKPSVGVPAGPGEDPASFAAAVPELVARNVRLLGGCCGTSEAHVAALAAACSHDVRSALSCSLMPGETL